MLLRVANLVCVLTTFLKFKNDVLYFLMLLYSKDVICRWSYPFVPDVYGSSVEKRVQYHSHNIYYSKDVTLARYSNLFMHNFSLIFIFGFYIITMTIFYATRIIFSYFCSLDLCNYSVVFQIFALLLYFIEKF